MLEAVAYCIHLSWSAPTHTLSHTHVCGFGWDKAGVEDNAELQLSRAEITRRPNKTRLQLNDDEVEDYPYDVAHAAGPPTTGRGQC